MSKEIAKTTVAGLPAEFLDDLINDAGMGTEDTNSADIAIPFLRVIQALSPQIDAQEPGFIQGAKKGQIFNTASNDLYDTVTVIPCYYHTQYIEWKPRTAGGGLVAIHKDESCLLDAKRNDKGKDTLPNGNEIVRTATFYALIVDEEAAIVSPVVIAMAGTQFKKAKNLNNLIQANKITNPKTGKISIMPMWTQVFELSSMPESNEKGKWDGWVVRKAKNTLEMKNARMFYEAGKAFYESIIGGRVKTESFENATDGGGIDPDSVM
jgi:hypothetical protein